MYVLTVVLPFWATWKCLDWILEMLKSRWKREPGRPEMRVVGETISEHVRGILVKVENA